MQNVFCANKLWLGTYIHVLDNNNTVSFILSYIIYKFWAYASIKIWKFLLYLLTSAKHAKYVFSANAYNFFLCHLQQVVVLKFSWKYPKTESAINCQTCGVKSEQLKIYFILI